MQRFLLIVNDIKSLFSPPANTYFSYYLELINILLDCSSPVRGDKISSTQYIIRNTKQIIGYFLAVYSCFYSEKRIKIANRSLFRTYQASLMEPLAKIVHGLQLSTIFGKIFHHECSQTYEKVPMYSGCKVENNDQKKSGKTKAVLLILKSWNAVVTNHNYLLILF